MRSSRDCAPCLLRQALESAGASAMKESAREDLTRRIQLVVSQMDFCDPPPAAVQKMNRLLRIKKSDGDPYREAKDRYNAMALASIESALDVAVNGDIDEFRKALESAGRILYLADNAGEIVFDRALIGMLPAGRVTVAVRGKPVINDATMSDAVVAGIPDIAAVIDNGSDAPGTVLADCSPAFIAEYRNSDLVVSKGQGNYETLSDEKKNIFFLLKIKCRVVASHSGFGIGTHALIRNRQ